MVQEHEQVLHKQQEELDNHERRTFAEISRAFGNGDYVKGVEILKRLAEGLNHARKKHPEWLNAQFGYNALVEEAQELRDEMVNKNDARQQEECRDVAVVAIRFLGREWE